MVAFTTATFAFRLNRRYRTQREKTSCCFALTGVKETFTVVGVREEHGALGRRVPVSVKPTANWDLRFQAAASSAQTKRVPGAFSEILLFLFALARLLLISLV